MTRFAPDGTAFDLHGLEDAPVIALIHGLGLCRHLWRDHLPQLASRYRIINYDLYGHGESAPPPTKASLTVYAQQLADLLDHLKIDNASVVGFSIGGMINRRFAMDFPQKLNALAILNSPHDRGEELQKQVEARAQKVREQGALSTMDDALKRWFTPDYLQGGEGAGLVREWRLLAEPESYAQAAWVLANGVRELIAPKESISVPTFIVTCENDTGSTPKMSSQIASEIENAELVIIPQLQHLGLMEDPSAFVTPVMEFLERKLT